MCLITENHYKDSWHYFSLCEANWIVYICIYIYTHTHTHTHTQQDATLHILFYLETALYVLGGTSTHHQERKQLYLQHLVFVTLLLLPAAIAANSSNGLTNTRCCIKVVWAPDDGWRYHPKHVEQFPDKINCVTLHLAGYILEHSYNARTHER